MNALTAPGPCRVALVTEVPFWQEDSGRGARIRTLVTELARHVRLTMIWPLPLDAAARAALAARMPEVQLHSLELPPQGSADAARQALAAFFAAQPQHACIFEYLALGWLRRAVPPGVKTFVDTHDVVSQRDAELSTLSRPLDRPVLQPEQEAARLRVFDHVIAISSADAAVFSEWVGAARVLLVPHAQPIRPLPLRADARRVLFVASAYAPNVEALAWMLDEVWPRVNGLTLDVVGGVGPALGRASTDTWVLHGPLPDLEAAYAATDLVINPVRHGSGLKIKSVEALAHGLPLVSTTHGVRGLEGFDPSDPPFAVADDAEAFATALQGLAADAPARQRLGLAAVRLARDRFSEAACLRPLLAALAGSRR